MYYDDEARRFNFASGLLLGIILGTGVALIARPGPELSGKALGRSVRKARRGARRASSRLSRAVANPAADKLGALRTAVRRDRYA